MPPSGPIVMFDGHCNLCNAWVSFIIARDPERRFRYATLQGAAGQAMLHRADPVEGSGQSVILLDGNQITMRSTAALKILVGLGLPWSVLGALLLVPRPLRDAVYDWVARNRHRWFGSRATCRVPTDEERALFLD